MSSKFYYVRVGDLDIRVKGTSYRDAQKRAKAGKGRVVGAYFDVVESAAVRRLRAAEGR